MMRSRFFLRFIQWGALMTALITTNATLGVAQNAEDLRMTVGKSVVIDYPSDIRQIDFSNPEILDGNAVTTREIVLHGKALGTTTMIVWSKSGQRTFYNVTVDTNVDPLKRLLKESFPNEDIQVRTSRDSISLNGHVSTKDVVERAMNLATPFAKTVVPNFQVGTSLVEKQILLRVKFAEIDRSKETQYGVNLLGMPGLNNLGSTTGQFGPPLLSGVSGVGPLPNSNQTTITQALNLFALNPKLSIGAFIKALQAESIIEILAEPTLIATNGKEAYFLVGGEFPIPVLQGGGNAGAVTIQFREFGIRLIFTPIITENRTIKMHLKQEVSQLDFSNGVTLSGFTIPALSTRRAETDVEMGEGQSFVIAGLVNNQEREVFNKIPVLGSLPIFGSLFKSKDEQRQRTDLVVIVTPEVTMPLTSSDSVPNLYMPKDFLVKLDPKDVPPPPPTTRRGGSPKSGKK
jgi:pilus assembly protein CpaC